MVKSARVGGRWMGRAGSPIQKGNLEIMIFHSFARSNYFVQLKYRFSPPPPPSPPLGEYVRLLRPSCFSPLIRGERGFFGAPSTPDR